MQKKSQTNYLQLMMKKIKNRKSIYMSFIVGTILSLITLIFIIIIINNYINEGKLKSSQTDCLEFFQLINSQKQFFGKGKDNPTEFFSKSISRFCPARVVEASENNLEPAMDLISSCYKMTGSGIDILDKTLVKNKAICLYCGSIVTTKNIDDFNKKLSKILKRKEYEFLFDSNTQTINTNEFFLTSKKIPKTLNKQNSISVFYFIYRPDFNEGIDVEKNTIKTKDFSDYAYEFNKEKISRFLTQKGDIGELLSQKISPKIKSLSGIVLNSQIDLNKENLLQKKVNIQTPFEECQLYVPEQIFDK